MTLRQKARTPICISLQECSNSEKLHEKEEKGNEGSHLTEKENIEYPTTSTTDSNSSLEVKVLETDSCGSVACLRGAPDVSHLLFEKSQQPESKMEPEFIKEKSPAYSNEEKEDLEEPVITEEKESDGDDLSSLLNRASVHNLSGLNNVKETNMQDGSVQFIKDHVTQCAFSFHNSLLYDLD
ncbi:protein kintoun isoform X3 [Mustela nigripes]|uniref:Protein kintoun isoform X3 n=1 Tax=Mustela putorius furo TaxID=9669 RepID=A0A8U0RIE2_MUSPF|nr:protein kintoun isoform X3 [Mustela putorius furo]XP_059038002.1 protein kintoun isoform X3 [Mustela lutreola]XP_059229128.1 protein kintoun isoform X3 [Mustela nigripes]